MNLLHQLTQILESVPSEEFKKNSRAVAGAVLAKLNVVNREEFDARNEMLNQSIVRLKELESKVAALESAQNNKHKS